MNHLLSFRQVSKQYPNGVKALKDVSFNVNAGEFISVIGPSGSGKSTLIRTINKLINVCDGEIIVDGENIVTQKGKKLKQSRCKIGMIFQHYNLVHRLSVLQNVLHGRLGYMSGFKGIFGLYSEEDKKAALCLLEDMGIEDYCFHRAGNLSGGQKQRVGIARAIMQTPKLLLCDEPIASLDPSSSRKIMDILQKMTKERHLATIVNLHQVDVAKKYSTRIIGIRKGSIVFDGTPEELTDDQLSNIYGEEWNPQTNNSPSSEPILTQPVLAPNGAALGFGACEIPAVGA